MKFDDLVDAYLTEASEIIKEIKTMPVSTQKKGINTETFKVGKHEYTISMTHADDIDEFYEEISDDWDETNILYKTGLEDKITDSSRGFYSVYFSKQGDGMSISDISHVGIKNAITVFATVGDYIMKKFRGKKGYVLHFTSDNSEPSRVKLYNRLIQFLSAKLSLKSMVTKGNINTHYFLYS